MRRNFLTTCTISGTRGKKLQADAALCGRSMVEMLGVLAIIGVLSVGAISGYSKAMMKYKLNKQTEQIGSILDYVTLYADALHDVTTWFGDRLLINLGAIPQEMIGDEDDDYIYDVFHNKVNIIFTGDGAVHYHAMRIDIGNNSHEICLNLYQLAKLHSALLWNTVFSRSTDDISYQQSNRMYGDAYCRSTDTCLKDLTISRMHELCEICDGTSSCTFWFLWNLRS